MTRSSSVIQAISAALASCAISAASADTIQFNRDIRPLLSDACFQCHGPDKNSREADLRLDLEAAAKADLGGYFGIVPGDAEASEIYQRMITTDHDDLMPPEESGKSLTPEEIALIKKWIEQGAPWQGHWAYVKPERAEPPTVKNTQWPQSPID